jgi:hypothetical protein
MQRLRHAPQWLPFDDRSTSHPFPELPSQSAKPVSQRNMHVPVMQNGRVPADGVGQVLPHAPQCVVLVWTSVSQPSVAVALQSPKPASQRETAQVPSTHAGVPFASAHATPQPPHVATVFRSASQPFAVSASQSAAPGGHDVTSHVPATHANVPGAPPQRASQAPQWSKSRVVSTQLVPHAVGAGDAHAATHTRALVASSTPHSGVPPPQVTPHPPQFADVARGASQPSTGSPLQSA